MNIAMMVAKLHGIRVTGAELHYEGSIALDPQQVARAGLMPFQFVEIWNKSSGARISTYIILGRAGSRCCVLNGAAARTCQVGDELIIAARAAVAAADVADLRPRVVLYGPRNVIRETVDYRIVKSKAGGYAVRRLPRR